MRSIQSNNAKRWGYYSIISALFVFLHSIPFIKFITLQMRLTHSSPETKTPDALISNACDRLWAEQVECRIEAYEQREGIQVTKIGFVPDQSMQWQWGDISYPWDVCLRAISIDWARPYFLSYYTGAGYSQVDVPDEVKAHFSSLDWDTINLEEQMIFDNEVCYICIF